MPLDPTQPFQVTLPDASHTFRVGFAPDCIPFVEVYVGDDLATPKFTINRPDIATAVAMLVHALFHQSAVHRSVGLAILDTLTSLPYAAPETLDRHYGNIRTSAELLTK